MKYFSFKKIIFCLLFVTILSIIPTNNASADTSNWLLSKVTSVTNSIVSNTVEPFITGMTTIVLKFVQVNFEFIWIPIADYVVALGGKLLNYSIEFTIFSSYGSSGNPLKTFDASIKEIWVIIRDTINIVFIFTLLYIAIQRILGSFKKEIFVGVLISAVFVNFSFFITRTAIDMGNILTSSIYNQIEIKSKQFDLKEDKITDSILQGISGTKSSIKLSEILRSIVGTDSVNKIAVLKDFNPENTRDAVGSTLLRFIMLIVLGFVFLLMSFLLVGRFIMLIFLMASSPIGFLWGSVPQIAKYASSWWNNLISQIAIAPIFMFFMLIVINISQNDGLKTARTGSASVGLFFNYILMIGLLMYSVKITKKMGGAVTNLAGKATSFVAGAALGAVTGGTALVGRQVVGRLAARTANSAIGTRLQQSAAKGGFAGGLSNLALKGIKSTASSSFDVRGSKTIQGSFGQIKSISGGAIDIKGAMDSVGNFGKAKAGGYEEWLKNKNETGKKAVGNYTEMVNEVEKDAEKKAQKDNKVKEKRDAARIAKEKLDRLDNMLSTAGTEDTTKATLLIQEENLAKQELDKVERKISQTKNPVEISKLTIEREKRKEEHKKKKEEKDKILKKNADIQRLTSQKNTAEQDYNNKKAEKDLAEEKTASGLSNMAENEFITRVPSTNATKAAYEQAKQRIKQLRDQQTNNKDNFDNNLKTKVEYERDEAELQNQIKEMIKEADEFKAKGVKEQMKTIEDLVLQNRPKGDPLIDIVNKRRMKNDFKERLKNKRLSLMTKEERRKMIEIIEEEEKNKDKK